MTSPTYIIKRSQVEAVLSMADCVPIVEDAFRLCGEGGVQMPPKAYLYFDKGDLRCMPAYIPAQNIAGVKNVNVHPANTDMPTVMATITLFDPETGFPLAIMDGTYITRMRTGAAGGVAAKYLAREDSATAAFIGAGAQARTQLEALLITRPNISRIIVFDAKPAAMDAFAQDVKDTCGLKVQCAASVAEALREADIVTSTTPARSPIVRSDFIRPGTHINAIGADARGKQELDPEILKRATLVIDNWLQASHGGEINVAVSDGIITREDIHADIGEIVTGKRPGRQSDEEVTVFDSTGLAIQDIAAAGFVYRKLMADEGLKAQLQTIKFS